MKLTVLSLFLALFGSAINAQTTITSSASGGNWISVATWIGGVIPLPTDNVIINSTVYAQGDLTCHDLTVTAGNILYNQYGGTVTVTGKAMNYGSILNNPGGWSLIMNLAGDVYNDGIWNVNTTNFVGSVDQSIEQTSGKSFLGVVNTSDSIGNLILESDVRFLNNTWNMNNSTIQTNGHKLITEAYILINGKIVSNDTLLLNNSYVQGMQFFGNVTLDGNTYLRQNTSYYNNVFNGSVTVLDTLANQWGSRVLINGNIVNKGSVFFNGYNFYVDLNGNVRNEGIWRPQVTNFVSTLDQSIEQAPGTSFKSIINNTDSIGDIILESDVMFEPSLDFQAGKTWTLNKAIIRTNGHKLMSEKYIFKDGRIISNDTLILNNTCINNMQFFGNYKLDGNVWSQYNTLPNHNVFNDTLTVLDTLTGEYNSTILVQGSIVNKGTIINSYLTGYPFILNIAGNLNNQGIWRPKETNLIGTADQTMQQAPGTSFESIINSTDSIGNIVLESNVMLKPYNVVQGGNTWTMNRANLLTNGHTLMSESYILLNGKIISNDTLFLNNSTIDNMQFFGNYKLDGNVFAKQNTSVYSNVFNDTLTVLDTLTNQWISNILINGDLINKGSIVNNWISGYSLNIAILGSITNQSIISNSGVYLYGTNPRTIKGNPGGIQASVFVVDSIHLAGVNQLQTLKFYTDPGAWCTIDSNASLTVTTILNPEKVTNYGRVSVQKAVDNSIANTLSFYEASMKSNAGVIMNKMVIDHYGYQQHPTANGTVNNWWRLRNTPQNFSDSLAWLQLNYKTEALNGNNEDSLKVFFSPNAGLSWERISAGVTLTPSSNTVTITNAPAYGHYLLSSSDLGITTFHPTIESVEPRFGGNTGYVSLYLFGAGFKSTSIVKLKIAGQSDIVSDTSFLTDLTGESMLARFKLANKALGAYDVVVETPAENTLTKPAYFSIVKGERSNPWISITGRDRILINRWATFNLNYGNSANTDAYGVPLAFVISDLPGIEVKFPEVKVVLPKYIIDLGPNYTKIADSVAIYYVTDSLSGYIGQNMRVYPFYIPSIPGGYAADVAVKIKLNGLGIVKMTAWVIDPFWENINYGSKEVEEMPMEVRACITYAAEKFAVQQLTGGLPILSCLDMVDKIFSPDDMLPDFMIPEPEPKPYRWGSFLWDFVAAGASIGQCATGFLPGLGTAVSYGLSVTGGILSMGDMAGNAGVKEGCWRKFRKLSQTNKNSLGANSLDPNEIVGPQGFASENYISKKGNLAYNIYFENVDTASAAAVEVFINDTLDVTKFDLSTFSFNSISFGDTSVNVQSYAKEFTLLVDLFPKKDIIVKVHGKLDTLNGSISWDFHSLDRITLELTEDPDLGFLAPNINYPEGEGIVSFSCRLKKNIAHDAIVTNQASIVFDLNLPMLTNVHANKIDTLVPISSVNVLSATQYDTSFTVSWSGSDQGCGINNYNVFVSENDSAYALWQSATSNTSAVFHANISCHYKFFSIAYDSIGLTEAQKLNPEATTTIVVGLDAINKPNCRFQLYPNPAADFVSIKIDSPLKDEPTICIYSIVGKLIGTQILQSDLQQIFIGDLSSGIYLVELRSKDWAQQQKLVIQR